MCRPGLWKAKLLLQEGLVKSTTEHFHVNNAVLVYGFLYGEREREREREREQVTCHEIGMVSTITQLYHYYYILLIPSAVMRPH